MFEDSSGSQYIATELCAGNALDIVQAESADLTVADRLFMLGNFHENTDFIRAADAACGMVYLASVNIIHSDLGLRNVLISKQLNEKTKYTVKIGDFGLSKRLHGEDYYKSKNNTLPIRWTAPEALGTQSFDERNLQ